MPTENDVDWMLIVSLLILVLCFAMACAVYCQWSRLKQQQKMVNETNIASTIAPSIDPIETHVAAQPVVSGSADPSHPTGKATLTAETPTIALECAATTGGPALQMEGTYSNSSASEGFDAANVTTGRGAVDTPGQDTLGQDARDIDRRVTAGYDEMGNGKKAVLEWLHTVRMEEYLSNFWDSGYESLDLVKAIESKAELAEIGITKPGHQIYLLKQIRQLPGQ